MTLNETPSGNRIHIGIFGKTNSGKSTLLNSFTNQSVSITSDVAGTTTDPVYKPMEIYPIGACVIIDTAGFDDNSMLGENRVKKTRLAAEKSDIAIMLFSAENLDGLSDKEIEVEFKTELEWLGYFKEKNTPVITVVNKADLSQNQTTLTRVINSNTDSKVILVSAKTGEGIEDIKLALARAIPENYGEKQILGNLVQEGDVVLLVMPQDIQATKGRLILPQVQTIRELLDRKCVVVSTTTDMLENGLKTMSHAPKLIVTDSQVFEYVYKNKPEESMLTSFSVLFAAYKGDIEYYVESAKAIDNLTEDSRVLIAECCTHAPLQEDIGREKIPNMLRKRFGEKLVVDVVSGTDFPSDLSGYSLVIQCGACMFNRKYVMSRIDVAKQQSVPMTNYGMTIAHLTGIIDKIVV